MTDPAAFQPLEFDLHGTTLRFHPSSLHLLSLAVAGEEWFSGGEAGEPLWQFLAVNEAGAARDA